MASAPARRAASMMRSPRRYVSAGAEPGRRTALSASRTCGLPASASEKTATVARPRRRHVATTRRAISPRLAVRTLLMVIRVAHPEDAEGVGALDRRGVDRGQGDAEEVAGVAGVDDAVVVDQPGQHRRHRL